MFTTKQIIERQLQATTNFLNGAKNGLQVSSFEFQTIHHAVQNLNKTLELVNVARISETDPRQ